MRLILLSYLVLSILKYRDDVGEDRHLGIDQQKSQTNTFVDPANFCPSSLNTPDEAYATIQG